MRGVDMESKYEYEVKGWNAQTYHLYSHCGTHIDAPIHYNVNDHTITDWPVERFMGTAWVIDLYPAVPDSLITPDDLGDIQHGFSSGDSLLINTGWGERLESPEYRDHLPALSEDFALWCAGHHVNMLGVETPAVANPNDIKEIQNIHRILLKADVIIIEGLCNLAALTRPKVQLIALPLKIAGADGAPVRALAIEE